MRTVILCVLAAALFSGNVGPVPALFPKPKANLKEKNGYSPFSIGEELIYKVEWNPPWYLFFLPSMEAGTAELRMAEETDYQDKKALKIVFMAKSSGTLARLAGVKVDDYFEFITDPTTFCTFSVVKKVREGKRKRDIEVAYYPESRRLHYLDVNVATRPPRVENDKFVEDIPGCVQDVFSALYSMRLKELDLDVSHRSLIGDNDNVKEVETRVEKREIVKTPLGKYEAWRLNTVALLGGLFKSGGKFRIWLTVDGRKLPVKFEAKVKLGKISGKLKAITQAGTRVRKVGDDHKPNSVSLPSREGDHSSGSGITPGI